MEPTPTADLDRSNDKVYDCTTSVVKAVMSLSQGKICYVTLKLCGFKHFQCTVVVASAFRNLCFTHRVFTVCLHGLCNSQNKQNFNSNQVVCLMKTVSCGVRT
jgi:hypothetical protein